MKGRRKLQELTAALSIIAGTAAFFFLIIGAQDGALGLGIWLCFASLVWLILWVGDWIVNTLHNTEEDSK